MVRRKKYVLKKFSGSKRSAKQNCDYYRRKGMTCNISKTKKGYTVYVYRKKRRR